MRERSKLIAGIRAEIVGPSKPVNPVQFVELTNREFTDPEPLRNGPLAWRPCPEAEAQEVLYFDRESPHRKYGAGLLHPAGGTLTTASPNQAAIEAVDTLGVDVDPDSNPASDEENHDDSEDISASSDADSLLASDESDDFEVTSPDMRRPSTMGISFCAQFEPGGRLIVRFPQSRRFAWQEPEDAPFGINGRYEECKRLWTGQDGTPKKDQIWRRCDALGPGCVVVLDVSEFLHRRKICKPVPMPDGSPITLELHVFPRLQREENTWLLTLVLKNTTQNTASREAVLYQCYFEAACDSGNLVRYPESQRPFDQLDQEEQSLALLYRESASWGIGHGCAAAWDVGPGEVPEAVYADVMPAVELPSMTPDIYTARGDIIQLSMRELATLTDDGQGPAWASLENLSAEYAAWIDQSVAKAEAIDGNLSDVAGRHLDKCRECLGRINRGIELLRGPNSGRARRAFRLANLAMLLQQISTKQLSRRPLEPLTQMPWAAPAGEHSSPWAIYHRNGEDTQRLGSWRAFQIAFLLLSIEGLCDGRSPDRDIVDLIWFPTGGGKTEAYLAAMAFYMFHERLLINDGENELRRDGTNVLMRYTLRMLTTQQFQRAASLICAMEYLRRNPNEHGMGEVPGERFSLGLWIGDDGSPNKISEAELRIKEFRGEKGAGNPLVLTECPWCRAEIGRCTGTQPPRLPQKEWNRNRVRGIGEAKGEGPLLHCTDAECTFGGEHWDTWLPVEVIDERIYHVRPSLVIATADKLAITAYRPAARTLFGLSCGGGQSYRTHQPPGLIIQDELHLISGPLGTMYALYEGVFERLCSTDQAGTCVKPKLIASTATIRGASDQVRSIYSREQTHLFPCPGLEMGDSFFGKYARDEGGALLRGRLYLGIHACDYGSVLTTQVRAFSAALFRPSSFDPNRRDAWWTLLAFYNSLRELGGAKTLFTSDIRSRLKFLFNREGFTNENRRYLRIVEELTSRLSQAEIVGMMDRLSVGYSQTATNILDACLASNIIEVGVDIDRLSLMGVVGQPKTTASYIQVTGRVGRKWWERPGLILMVYNPSKNRDRSHFEQFHSYHRRLYERVEPTSATPFAVSAVHRGFPGAMLAWARQQSDAEVQNLASYEDHIEFVYDLLKERCEAVQAPEDRERSLKALERMRDELLHKWEQNPMDWERYPQTVDGEYLMLWPGQFATQKQKHRGLVVQSSMRQVDGNSELEITQGYAVQSKPTQHQAHGK
jgi:hypothetical protein